ncbi:hypothetical protein J4760_05835 [Salinicoccus sp. ID82-1]|uniref:Uncharacterized protein n=1 Tax=Salinicoccus cyprini TaxID=2493691 RepID=A0A558ART2_9STAP|nr:MULTISPECIES: hypothetical protein [Salinicoccus]MCG1009535.1 hypothetical protein [Salinicoccus sp. ID82-1]TVT26969.1 hypothetical protein FO441_10745 [Salinicoccus cyprini]
MGRRIINSAAASLVTTLAVLTVSFLILLFSSAEIDRRTGYFGAIFFEGIPTSPDAFNMTFGISNIMPVIFTFIALTVTYYFILRLFSKKG